MTSSVLRWPDRDTVDRAARRWAADQAAARPELLRLGYFGSYATGRWGVGSDLDLVAVVARSERPFTERGRDWDLTRLPVPAEILVYTLDEWRDLQERGGRFVSVLKDDTVWLVIASIA